MARTSLIVTALLLIGVLSTACFGDDKDPIKTATATAPPTATPPEATARPAPGDARDVPLGGPFSLSVGDLVEVGGAGLTLRFDGVDQDSRCPRDVTCV